MNIYENYLLKLKTPHIMRGETNQNFGGNIKGGFKTIKLGADEFAKVSSISKNYQQLQMLYSSAGNYVGDLLKKGITFLIPLGLIGFRLKNIFKQDDTQDVKIVRNDGLKKTDELITFTINGENDSDIAQITVSKSGTADISVNKNLSENEAKKYVNEIDKNYPKFFDSVLHKTENALTSAEKILIKKDNYELDLFSPAKLSEIARQFVDEKKRLSLMAQLVKAEKFVRNFNFQSGQPKSVEQGIIPAENISFRFSHLENRCFDGMQITVTDKNKGTRQGFVINYDGVVMASKEHQTNCEDGSFVPNKDWRVRNMTALTDEEIVNIPFLKRMFKYAYSHVDKVYRKFLTLMFEQNKSFAQMYDNACEEQKKQINETESKRWQKINDFNERIAFEEEDKLKTRAIIQSKPLAEDNAKIIKVYNIEPAKFDIIKKIASYNDSISNASFAKQQYQRQNFIEGFGLIRRKSQNGLIFDNILKNDELKLGIARYTYKDYSEELLNFGIFDRNLDEMARFKATKDGKLKILVKPDMTLNDVQKIETAINNEINNGMVKRLLNVLDYALYYLQNTAKVDSYIKKSYTPLNIQQAIDELKSDKKYYNFSNYKIQTLKDTIESIKEIYRVHQSAVYRWQKLYFPDIEKCTKYLYGRLNKYDINYEFSFIQNEYVSGLRILTSDEKGNFINGYIIDYDGNVSKLIKLSQKYGYSGLSYTPTNLSRLDENAVKSEHLDLIFDKLYRTTFVYNDFLQECSAKLAAGRYKFLAKDIEEISRKYKYPQTVNQTESLQNSAIDYAHSNEIKKVDRRGKHSNKHNTYAKNRTSVSDITVKNKKASKSQTSEIKKQTEIKLKPKQNSINAPVTEKILTEQKELKPELKERYANMLKPNGEFKSLQDISLEDVVEQLNRIFALPYTERSSHYVHDLKSNGDVFAYRFSVEAPDGAWITVTKNVVSEYSPFHYSIRVQKGNEIMYLNIDPEFARVIRCDKNNNIMLSDDGKKLKTSKDKFEAKNPLSQNLSMYFREIFDERTDGERKTIKFQVFNDKKSKIKMEKQAKNDFGTALKQKLSLNFQEEENRI